MTFKPTIVGLPTKSSAELSVTAGDIVTKMTAAAAVYVTPDPSLASITTAKSDVDTAIATTEAARVAYEAAKADEAAKAEVLRGLLTSEILYVNAICDDKTAATTPTQRAAIESSGMSAAID